MPTVIHQPRVAWDGARAFVRAAASPHAGAFADRLLDQLGGEAHIQFSDTRERLRTAFLATGGDRHAADLESGKWRVRLEELLRTRPDLADEVRDLTAVAAAL